MVILIASCLLMSSNVRTVESSSPAADSALREYLDFFEKVYDTMEKNYYQPVPREIYDRFIEKFKTRIYSQLRSTGKSVDFIRWRSAAYLIDFLKSKEDIFSAFIPPQFAEKFEKKVLGQKVDLGIEGEQTPKGFLVKFIEPRSDAYQKGLKKDDVILKVAGKDTLALKQKEVEELLTPLIDTKISVEYWDSAIKRKTMVELLSQKYFKQTVFMVPVNVPHIFCLQIKSFNQKTGEEMFQYLNKFEAQGESGLILDLRGNPGGPPLAAREISSFFLTGGDEFAYFQKKDKPKASLDVPKIPEQYHYTGPVVILVNKESGSAAELFSGVLQRRGRAVLMGTNTAGQVFLKSMFRFNDESMVLLVTARGFYPDGSTFSFEGLIPNEPVSDPKADLAEIAAEYLARLKSH